jgi:hypothetical protein
MTPEERENLHRKVFSAGKVDQEALKQLANEYRKESDERYFGKAIELWMAGWNSFPVTHESQIMSWYWRRPRVLVAKRAVCT